MQNASDSGVKDVIIVEVFCRIKLKLLMHYLKDCVRIYYYFFFIKKSE